MPSAGAQPNKSLIDGIATLQALASASEPVGCRELARQLGLETSRVNRLLKTLTYLGIARQTRNRKYTSGPGMHILASQSLFASGLIQRALPLLEQLHAFGHIIAMGVLWRDQVSYLYHALPHMSGNEALGRIGLYPATMSGIGMALLSTHSDDEIVALYQGDNIPNFPKGMEALLSEVHRIRKEGYAYILANQALQHHTVAVTLGDPIYSAIGMSGEISGATASRLAATLQNTARAIEAT